MPARDILTSAKALWLMTQTLYGLVRARTRDGMDLRAVVTERQLEEHLSDPDAYIWELAFRNNDKLRGPPIWLETHGWLYEQYTRPQQVLLLIGHLDAEVLNGGFSQLFYNEGTDAVAAMREALAEIGCPASAELIAQEIARFRKTVPDGVGDEQARQVGYDEFMARHFPAGSETDKYGELRDEMMRRTLAYMRTNSEDLRRAPQRMKVRHGPRCMRRVSQTGKRRTSPAVQRPR